MEFGILVENQFLFGMGNDFTSSDKIFTKLPLNDQLILKKTWVSKAMFSR